MSYKNFPDNQDNSNNKNSNNRISLNNPNIRSSRMNLSNSINISTNLNNLSDMEKKKLQLIFEMDEYHNKYIKKYDSRKDE